MGIGFLSYSLALEIEFGLPALHGQSPLSAKLSHNLFLLKVLFIPLYAVCMYLSMCGAGEVR